MKIIGLINDKLIPYSRCNSNPIQIAENEIKVGTLDVNKPRFDKGSYKNSGFVLIKVLSFSCNYRDKAIIVKNGNKINYGLESEASPISYFGSDFVGEVIAIGPDVKDLKIGDRVIPDCAYPDAPAPNVAPGVVTNEASKGWLRLHHSKLLKIDTKISNNIAAGFSIGGQTSESMIRRSNINSTERALVLSARSNTSLFIIRGLLNRGINTTILSTTPWSKEELSTVQGAEYFYMERKNIKWPDILGKFDVIFDPFFDLHIGTAVNHLNVGGRYITCGYKNQHKTFYEPTDYVIENKLQDIMLQVMINNISIIGNCIGTTEDLVQAIRRYDIKNPPFKIYGSFTPNNGDDFLHQTYNVNARFGKVIMNYRE
ncbi:MDR/zinc-dependent alcohol dehydrogenase-like family protein [Bombilactobacillus thymidiniphilus]|uniref:Medium chain dehydrogenase/reductase family protein n=1 Tax=Bombilactobacillus thymidiniphilus TaxID=2923363 RepID=A0ABY4PF29_9LACO|nr:medium chain dehydrogenase/reductase family protein [Bombilactobacillus thymidiniphilus]UQS84126.1 medium chain dehydrogenase/reductase family protein [Bombilactobacillus thymidiniphilus]